MNAVVSSNRPSPHHWTYSIFTFLLSCAITPKGRGQVANGWRVGVGDAELRGDGAAQRRREAAHQVHHARHYSVQAKWGCRPGGNPQAGYATFQIPSSRLYLYTWLKGFIGNFLCLSASLVYVSKRIPFVHFLKPQKGLFSSVPLIPSQKPQRFTKRLIFVDFVGVTARFTLAHLLPHWHIEASSAETKQTFCF